MRNRKLRDLFNESDFWIGFNVGGTLVGFIAISWLLLNTYF